MAIGTDVRHWAAVEWSGDVHELCVVDADGAVVERRGVPHGAEGLAELALAAAAHRRLGGVAIEGRPALLVQALLEAGVTVYPINPKLSKHWRGCRSVAGRKDDGFDALALADGLRYYHSDLRPLELDDDETRRLQLLCRDEQQLIAERTGWVNRLQGVLRQYYPQATEWFADWTTATAWDFILTFPSPADLAAASTQKLVGFLRTHRIRVTPCWRERLAQRAHGPAWPADPVFADARADYALAAARVLRTLDAQLRRYRTRIRELFAAHPDAAVFASLPGAGAKLAPRLLAAIGNRRDRYDSARALQELSGTVPVTRQSGTRRKHVAFRRACRKDFRNTLHLFAFQSTLQSPWARAYYERRRAAGDNYALALRKLGAAWLKIIYRLWQSRTPYDERVHLASLAAHDSPLISHIHTSERCGELIQKRLT
jgi:transposase